MQANAKQGREAEAKVRRRYESQGYKCRTIREGGDFVATKNGRSIVAEAKSGKTRHVE